MSETSRRDFLASMIGLPAALSACKRPFRAVEGSLVGASPSVGHLLRDGVMAGEPSREIEVPVVIVGGGPSGLSAAWRLERLGEPRFVVLELEEREGGTSLFGERGVVPHPFGAHYVPVPRPDNRALVSLLIEMGALHRGHDGALEPDEATVVREPEERHYVRGQWHEGLYPRSLATEADLAELAAFQREVQRLASLRDGRGRRAFTLPMERGSDDPEFTALDGVSARDFLLSKGLTGAPLHWLVDYACRDDYGLRSDDTSAWAALFYFASRVPDGGGEAAPLFSWPEGNGRFVKHLASVAGERVRPRSLVVDVTTDDERCRVLCLDTASRSLVRYVASRVVFAAPKLVASRVLAPLREGRERRFEGFTYGAWAVANVHLDAHPRSQGAPLAWDNVLHASPSLGYVVATHQAMIDEGPTVLTYYLPYADRDASAGRKRLLSATHEDLCDLVMAELGPAHRGLASQVQRIDVARWGHAMVQPRPGFVFGASRRQAALPLGRVHMAHSDISGLALLEESLHHGVRAAEEVFTALHPARAEGLERLG